MAKRLVPLLNRVLVEKIVPPSKTNAGILLPEKSSKLNSGKVIAVGPGIHDKEGKLIPVAVKEGDTVLLPEYGGTELKLGDKDEIQVFVSSIHIEGKASGSGLPSKNALNSTSDLSGCENGASWAAPLMVANDNMSPYTCVHPATFKITPKNLSSPERQ
ncbi:10 kDa chaperonin, mitochondrial-like [Senna tora]|uniref:Protein groES n=1 Tax=Senna tora TaxID=362788 RepID=A0A834WE03_9FABA|nr:10 kDa chaperonin, mitochondrial-like [Senna tora]